MQSISEKPRTGVAGGSGGSGSKNTKATLTLAELESQIIAVLDYAETVGRPLDARERETFLRLDTLFNSPPIRKECAELPWPKRDYYNKLYMSLRQVLAPDPVRAEYTDQDTAGVLSSRRRKRGDPIRFPDQRLAGILGIGEPLDYPDLSELAKKTLADAITILRELHTLGVQIDVSKDVRKIRYYANLQASVKATRTGRSQTARSQAELN